MGVGDVHERILQRVPPRSLQPYCSAVLGDELDQVQTQLNEASVALARLLEVQEAAAKMSVPVSQGALTLVAAVQHEQRAVAGRLTELLHNAVAHADGVEAKPGLPVDTSTVVRTKDERAVGRPTNTAAATAATAAAARKYDNGAMKRSVTPSAKREAAHTSIKELAEKRIEQPVSGRSDSDSDGDGGGGDDNSVERNAKNKSPMLKKRKRSMDEGEGAAVTARAPSTVTSSDPMRSLHDGASACHHKVREAMALSQPKCFTVLENQVLTPLCKLLAEATKLPPEALEGDKSVAVMELLRQCTEQTAVLGTSASRKVTMPVIKSMDRLLVAVRRLQGAHSSVAHRFIWTSTKLQQFAKLTKKESLEDRCLRLAREVAQLSPSARAPRVPDLLSLASTVVSQFASPSNNEMKKRVNSSFISKTVAIVAIITKVYDDRLGKDSTGKFNALVRAIDKASTASEALARAVHGHHRQLQTMINSASRHGSDELERETMLATVTEVLAVMDQWQGNVFSLKELDKVTDRVASVFDSGNKRLCLHGKVRACVTRLFEAVSAIKKPGHRENRLQRINRWKKLIEECARSCGC